MGKETRYRYLPSTVIIFITQEDIFGKDLAKYTFSEWCEEVSDPQSIDPYFNRAGRMEEIEKAVTDKTYQKKLFDELGI